jgi:hypothetical protein
MQSSFGDVVIGNLHNEQVTVVMDLEIKFNNWMRSNIEPLEIIKQKIGTTYDFVCSNLIWNLAFAYITNRFWASRNPGNLFTV